MPPHDETSPVEPRSGSVRRPPSTRARTGAGGGAAAGGARRPASAGATRGRTTAPRSAGGPPGSRPPGKRPTGGSGGGGRKGPRTPKQRWMRRLKIALAALLGLFLLLGVFVGVVYATTDVPDPDSVTAAQTTVVYYGDGTTEMARLGKQNRMNVKLAEVSEPARNAVLAAENRSFYRDPGISFTGIVRAAWNDLTGGSTQGGSTITQQYVKNAFLNSNQTFSRKFKELFLSVKLDNSYSKDQILENYLNTIYFGRSAYGIEAAAETYFGVPAAKLTAQQGAVLAVLIRNPAYYDPAKHPQDAQARWGDVLDGMVQQKWLTPAERQSSAYPPVLPRQTDSTLGMPDGPEGLVVAQAVKELESKGYSDDQIYNGGLRVTTTVQKKDEDAAIAAVADTMKGQPGNLRQALVAVDPKTGAVLAYYGGPKGSGDGSIDYAQAQRPPGSSMKPYTLATGLEQGISVNAIRNGSSPQKFPDRDKPVANAGNEACAACTLTQAITESLNTVFYGEALEVHPDKVRQTALAAMDLPDTWSFGVLKGKKTLADPATATTGGAIGIGQYEVRTVDQAVGFASFASGGIQRDAYYVAKVTDSEGKVLLQNNGSPSKQVMPPDVAHDVTYALEGVAAWSKRALQGGRPVASKTGTQGQNGSTVNDTDAWMVGYTPSISAAVWMGNDKGNDAITTAAGKPIYGSGLPGQIWQQFMNTVLKGTPVEKLPSSPIITGDKGKPINPVAVASTSSAPSTSSPSTRTSAAPTSAAPTTTAAPSDGAAPTSSAAATTTTPPVAPPPGAGLPLPGRRTSASTSSNGNGGGGPGGGGPVG